MGKCCCKYQVHIIKLRVSLNQERVNESAGEMKKSEQNVRNYIIAKVLTSFALILSPTTFNDRQRIVTKTVRTTLCVRLFESH